MAMALMIWACLMKDLALSHLKGRRLEMPRGIRSFKIQTSPPQQFGHGTMRPCTQGKKERPWVANNNQKALATCNPNKSVLLKKQTKKGFIDKIESFSWSFVLAWPEQSVFPKACKSSLKAWKGFAKNPALS